MVQHSERNVLFHSDCCWGFQGGSHTLVRGGIGEISIGCFLFWWTSNYCTMVTDTESWKHRDSIYS
jgi:hypothetical protein